MFDEMRNAGLLKAVTGKEGQEKLINGDFPIIGFGDPPSPPPAKIWQNSFCNKTGSSVPEGPYGPKGKPPPLPPAFKI